MRVWMFVFASVVTLPALAQDQNSFTEDFDTLDRDRWFVSDGWVNGPHQNCLWSKSAVGIKDGVLQLTLDQSPGGPQAFTCAEIQSNDRFTYGVFEATVRVPFAAGTNSNFFTFIGAPQQRPHHEIDFEFIARTGPTLQTNTYVDGVGGNEELIPVTDADGWHDIAFVWEPERLRWYMDGELIRTAEGDIVPDLPQKMYLSIWSTDQLTDWLGRLEWTEPLVLEVQSVSYTPLGATCRPDAAGLCPAKPWDDAKK